MENIQSKSSKSLLARRYQIAILSFFGFFNVYALRVNLSIAVVKMTEEIEAEDTHLNNYTYREFDWDSKQQGLLLSSFFYGYIVTQIPGGWLAPYVGSAKLFGFGILATALATLFTPVIARAGLEALIAVRILEGLFEGVTFPAMHALWSNWAPPMERSRLATIGYSGNYVGTVVAMITCGFLAEHAGWESVFYVYGVVGVIWCSIWLYTVKESPALDKNISSEERNYIESSIGVLEEKGSTPWRSILMSFPVWAIIAAHFSENWGFYTLLTQLPTFLSDVTKFKLDKTGFMAAIPYLAMAVAVQGGGLLADLLRTRFNVSTTWVSYNQLKHSIHTQRWEDLHFGQHHEIQADSVVFPALYHRDGFQILSNTFATIPGIISPGLTGIIVQDKEAESWHIVFYISAAIYLLGGIFYLILIERQKWALCSR
ncbi:sialin-like [Artemia franciscana]|uniref:sialin-like n=1 Tax=Artemia franciscana TaxID=6661 RepID=UPI0032DA7237